MGDINKIIILGNVGREPEINHLPSGATVAKFSVATTQNWKDKQGDWKSKVEWHQIVTFNKPLIEHFIPKIQKGDRVYIEGVKETREYEKDGVKTYFTEISIPSFTGVLSKQPSRKDGGEGGAERSGGDSPPPQDNDGGAGYDSSLDDDIPF